MKPKIAVALRERLGEDATHALSDYIESSSEKWRDDVITACTERMDLRLEHLASREDLAEGVARIAQEIGNIRAELLRWSFVFWISQVAATVGLLSLLLRLLQA